MSDNKFKPKVALSVEYIRKPDGTVVRHEDFGNGSYAESNVFADDYPDAKAPAPAKPAKKSGGDK